MKASEYLLPMADALEKIFPKAERKAKIFLRKGENVHLKITLQKGSGSLEPWQRVGCYTAIRLDLIFPIINSFFGFKKNEVLLSGSIRSKQFVDYYWHCDGDKNSVDKLCNRLIHTIKKGKLETLFQQIEKADMLERYLWGNLESYFKNYNWNVPEPAKFNPFYLSKKIGINQEILNATYIYCLLQRNDFDAIEKNIKLAQNFTVKPPKELLQILEKEIFIKKDKNNELIKLQNPKLEKKKIVKTVVNTEIGKRSDVSVNDYNRPVKFSIEPIFNTTHNFSDFEWKGILASLKTNEYNFDENLDKKLSQFNDIDRSAGYGFWNKLTNKEIPWLKYCRSSSVNGKPQDAEKMQWLEHLIDWEFDTELDWKLPKLKSIKCGYNKYLPKININLFKDNPLLESLSLNIEDTDIATLTTLEGIERLKHLELETYEFDKGLRDLLKSQKLNNLQTLKLKGEVKSSLTTWLAKEGLIPNLKTLKLERLAPAAQKKIYPKFVKAYPNLENLDFEMDYSVPSFELPKSLKHLTINISGKITQITNSNKEQKLKTLSLDGYGLGLDSIKKLVKWTCIDNIEQLNIKVSEDFSKSFETLAKLKSNNIKVLIIETYELDDNDIKGLIKLLNSLDTLEVFALCTSNETEISDGMANKLVKATENLKSLFVDIKPFVSSFFEVGNYKNLEHAQLTAYYTDKLKITESHFENINKINFPNLRFLDLQSLDIDVKALEKLSSSDSLIQALSFDYHTISNGFAHLSAPKGLQKMKFLQLNLEDSEKIQFKPLKKIGIDVVY